MFGFDVIFRMSVRQVFCKSQKIKLGGSFEEQTHNLKRELPLKRTTPKLRFWKETLTLRKLQ